LCLPSAVFPSCPPNRRRLLFNRPRRISSRGGGFTTRQFRHILFSLSPGGPASLSIVFFFCFFFFPRSPSPDASIAVERKFLNSPAMYNLSCSGKGPHRLATKGTVFPLQCLPFSLLAQPLALLPVVTLSAQTCQISLFCRVLHLTGPHVGSRSFSPLFTTARATFAFCGGASWLKKGLERS